MGFSDLTNLFVLSRCVVGAIDAAGLTPSLTGRVRSDPIGWAYKLAQELWRESARVRRLRDEWVILPYSLRTCLKNLATAAELAASEGDSAVAGDQIEAVHAEALNANATASAPCSLDALEDDVYLASAEIAAKVGVDPERLRKRLDRFRANNLDCFREIASGDRKPREPQYLYRIGAVRGVITSLIASSETSGERPAKSI